MSKIYLRREKGFLFPFFNYLFDIFHKWFSVIGWIETLNKNWIGNRTFVEIYQLVWLAVIIMLFFLGRNNVAVGIAFFRLFDIMVSTIRLSFFSNDTPRYPARSLILIFFNIWEIILIFSIANFVLSSNFSNIYEGFRYSVDVFVPFISTSSRDLPICYVLFLIEIGVSVIIHFTIVQRILSYFEFKKPREY